MSRRPKLGEELRCEIRDRILRREFPADTKLPTETALCQQFRVSRTVVREALASLREEGLVYSKRGSGTFVTQRPGPMSEAPAALGSIADVERFLELRTVLEGEIAALAAQRRQKKDIKAIAEAIERLDGAADSGAQQDFAFHLAVAEATANPFFVFLLQTIRPQTLVGMRLGRSLSILFPAEQLNLVKEEHKLVLNAIVKKDAAAACAAMHAHIGSYRRRLIHGTTALGKGSPLK